MMMKKSKKNLPGKLPLKKKLPIEELEIGSCENCGYEFRGHFCPNCGQEVAEFNRPFGFVLYDFIGNFFAFDTRFFDSFWKLLARPGFLTAEFFNGRRVRYSPPFRMFVFLSFVLFLMLELLSQKGLNTFLEAPINDSQGLVKSDSTLLQSVDSLSVKKNFNVEINNGDEDIVHLDSVEFDGANIRDNLRILANHFEERLKVTSDPDDREKLISIIGICSSPELLVAKFLKYLSWSFFILLPVFALLLKLFYLKRKQYFIRHFIFSIHFHSYIFFMLIIAILLGLIFNSLSGYVLLIGFISIPVYFLLAMKNFYGQGIRKLLSKFIGVSIVYNVILFGSLIYVFVNALGFV